MKHFDLSNFAHPASFIDYCVVVLEPAEIETTEEKTTVPSVQEHGNKRIAIPRKKPIKIIRKPVFSHDPRRTEIAAMSILTVLLNGLAVFLYW